MQEPSIPDAAQFGSPLLEVNMRETAFCVNRETLTPARKPGMAAWRETLFFAMARNSSGADTIYITHEIIRALTCRQNGSRHPFQ